MKNKPKLLLHDENVGKIPYVNSKSLHVKLKSCASCRRTLPTYFFGIRRYSMDGYNSCCKECRNYKKRQLYTAEITNENFEILPLNEANFQFLQNCFIIHRHFDLVGLKLDEATSLKILLKINDSNNFSITLNFSSERNETLIYSGHWSDFTKRVLSLLTFYQVRLFHSENKISLSNWGVRTSHP